MLRRSRRRGVRVAAAAGLAALGLVLSACTPVSHPPQAVAPGPYSTKPNIVFVLTDDLSRNLVPYMPHVAALQRAGMTFRNYTVTDSLCCPSRTSIFTGEFPHDSGVFTNARPDGGFYSFGTHHDEDRTFAVALHDAGYRTALFGKYLNGIAIPSKNKPAFDAQAHYVPPGWSQWGVAGYGYNEFNYDLSVNRRLQVYGHRPQAYLTTVLNGLGNHFIRSSVRKAVPFMLEVSTFAPHSPYTPAPRDVGTFHVDAPRGPTFNRHPRNAPRWLAKLPPLNAARIATIDRSFNERVEAVQSVDRMIGHLENTLRVTGQLGNTIFVFSSDNGYHMGEHGLNRGKLTAFDTDVHVPLVVAGPGIRPGTVNDDVVENVDLAPTFEQLAGAPVPSTVDGRGLVPLLHGGHPAWRTLATIEHHGPGDDPDDPDGQTAEQGNPPSYNSIHTPAWSYVRYRDGEREYYDTRVDPNETDNVVGALAPSHLHHLDETLHRLVTCHGGAQCWAAAQPTAG